MKNSSSNLIAAFVLGGYLGYSAIPIFSIAIAVLFAVLFSIFFPETPTFLVKQNRIPVCSKKCQNSLVQCCNNARNHSLNFLQEAEKSIRFYHSLNETADRELITAEIEILKMQIGSCAKVDGQSIWSSVKWTDFTQNPGRKALMVGSVLAMLTHMRYY